MRKLAFALTAALVLAGPAAAQTYPVKGKTITTIVPSTAGGGTDTAARLIAPLLEKLLGTTVEVVNKPGASMQIGMGEAARAKPDGYTLIWSVLPTFASIYLDEERKSPFKRDSLKPIVMYYGAPFGIAVQASSPHKTLKDLVDAAKASPGKLRSGTTGFMSTGHFANIAFQQGTGTQMATVNFQGGGPQVTALLGGHIDVGFNSIGELVSQQKSGALRILAVMDEQRSPLLPEVPTTREAGFEVSPIGSDIGLSAPAGTPDAIVQQLAAAMKTAMADGELKAKMLEIGNTVTYLDPAAYTKFWDNVDARFKPLIEAARKQGQ
ncbi:tripartite tricarboxylate transporter substrate binding protein [Bosea sp. (in: a-proteobacteria)]|uniref:Bug family tripartite tricarboxylate transporter substrate binding protein n=1 Tax=Bosea sp. (in: a-proteobacteria) TaxID=1871050 RepID=UPI00263011DC|nr:tripartite tricarboxylate transporter substrate binding protein [Bosea sp. (in: a-proteobacteria)]MCO5091688.1 tripartite tricarboxylate transporter substrate binding protein [Bosea sp. (in: a-proteobacteria)]